MTTSSRISLWLAALGIIAGVQCGGGNSSGGNGGDDAQEVYYQLTFEGSGYNPHDGNLLRAALVDLSTGNVVKTEDTVIENGAFQFVWADVLEDGGDYKLYYFADKSGNGECNAPPVDHGWSLVLSNIQGDRTVSEVHNLNFDPNVCDPF